MAILGFIWELLLTLPQLVRIYGQLKSLFGDNLNKVEADLQKQVELVQKSKDPNLTTEQKRELRREALRAGVGMFGRID